VPGLRGLELANVILKKPLKMLGEFSLDYGTWDQRPFGCELAGLTGPGRSRERMRAISALIAAGSVRFSRMATHSAHPRCRRMRGLYKESIA
jgi:hypothetical protein